MQPANTGDLAEASARVEQPPDAAPTDGQAAPARQGGGAFGDSNEGLDSATPVQPGTPAADDLTWDEDAGAAQGAEALARTDLGSVAAAATVAVARGGYGTADKEPEWWARQTLETDPRPREAPFV
jgi:hypothetical protein